MKIKNLFYMVLICLLTAQFVGCIAAAAAYQAAALGGLAKSTIDSIEKADIDAAVSPGVTTEQLSQIKRVAFIFSKDNQTESLMLSKGLTGIMSDNLTIEMMKLGVECVESQKLKKALEDQGIQITGPIDLDNAIKAGKSIGVQAIITGNVRASASFKASGILSTKMSSTSVIQSASLKIIGVENGDTLMVVAINYKHGQKPDKAAKSMARIIKAKLENPFGDEAKKEKK